MTVTDSSTLPPGLPRGAFRAVTDAAYRFVLTLSGHTPFDLAESVAPTTRGNIDAIIARSRASFAYEDRRQLVHHAIYRRSSCRFRERNRAFAACAANDLLDRRTMRPPTRRCGQRKLCKQWHGVRCSFICRRHPSPFRTTRRASTKRYARCKNSPRRSRFNQRRPTWLLALLARQHALVHLAADGWYTLGGCNSSRNVEKHGASTTAQVWGIDALSRAFLVRTADQLFDAGERSVPFSVWDDPLGPLLKDVSGAQSAVLRACPANRAGLTNMRTCCTPLRQSVSR
jgi:hypothetical protein